MGISYHHYEQTKKNDWNWESAGFGLAISGGLLADDATGIGVLDDVAIPFVLAGAGVLTLYDNRELLLKYAKDLSRAAASTLLTPGFQYSLRATRSGLYPTMIYGSSTPTGTTYMNTGDIWKYGITTEGFGRYGVNELKNIGIGVAMIPEFFGTYPQIKLMEKMKIYKYFFEHGELPPGNKIFR